MFVAPTSFRAIKQADPHAKLVDEYDLSSLKALFLAGEHSDPDTLSYISQALAKYDNGTGVKDGIDHWWQTELGIPAVGNAIGLGRMPQRPGSCFFAAPGFDVRVLDDDGAEVLEPQTLGNMVLKTPMPPGTLPTLYKNDKGYVESYLTKYPGFYDTGDAAFKDSDGYIYVMGRTDDLINTAGHRMSTGALEEVLQSHPDVAECAVVPVHDAIKGSVPVGFVVTIKGCTMPEEQLKAELIEVVRDSIGPVASFKKVAIVNKLPKTRSGKVLRGTMSKICNGEPYTVTPTVEDPAIFEYLEPVIKKLVGK
jgi:propionyl-CoA synthetase